MTPATRALLLAALVLAMATPALAADAGRDSTRSSWRFTLDGGIGFPSGPKLYRELYEPGLGGGLTVHRPLAGRLSAAARIGYLNLPFDAGDNPFDVGLTYRAAEGALNWADATGGLEVAVLSWFHLHARAGFGAQWGREIQIIDIGGGTTAIFDPGGNGATYGGGVSWHFRVTERPVFIEAGWLRLERTDASPDQIVIRAGSTVP